MAAKFYIPDGYDSDVEAEAIEPNPGASTRYGQKAIQAIYDNALEIRTASKTALKNHTYQAAAPSTQISSDRWYNIFNSFLETLNHPPGAKPNSDQLYRFIDSMVRTVLKPHIKGKPVISLDTVTHSARQLVSRLVEEHGFTATPQDQAKLTSLFHTLVKEKKLIKGKWLKSARVSYSFNLYSFLSKLIPLYRSDLRQSSTWQMFGYEADLQKAFSVGIHISQNSSVLPSSLHLVVVLERLLEVITITAYNILRGKICRLSLMVQIHRISTWM